MTDRERFFVALWINGWTSSVLIIVGLIVGFLTGFWWLAIIGAALLSIGVLVELLS